MTPILRACSDIDCTGCRCHAHPFGRGYLVPDPLRAPGTDDYIAGLYVPKAERPTSGWLIVWGLVAFVIGLAGIVAWLVVRS